MVDMNFILSFSVSLKFLLSEKSRFRKEGPSRTPTPALPKRPMSVGLAQRGVESGHPGILNAAGLNHSVMDPPPGGTVLTPGTTSGRPPIVFVLEVSKP